MRGLRAKRVRMVKEGTLIATVDIGATTNTGYCTNVDGRDMKVFKFGNKKRDSRSSGIWSLLLKTGSNALRS